MAELKKLFFFFKIFGGGMAFLIFLGGAGVCKMILS